MVGYKNGKLYRQADVSKEDSHFSKTFTRLSLGYGNSYYKSTRNKQIKTALMAMHRYFKDLNLYYTTGEKIRVSIKIQSNEISKKGNSWEDWRSNGELEQESEFCTCHNYGRVEPVF